MLSGNYFPRTQTMPVCAADGMRASGPTGGADVDMDESSSEFAADTGGNDDFAFLDPGDCDDIEDDDAPEIPHEPRMQSKARSDTDTSMVSYSSSVASAEAIEVNTPETSRVRPYQSLSPNSTNSRQHSKKRHKATADQMSIDRPEPATTYQSPLSQQAIGARRAERRNVFNSNQRLAMEQSNRPRGTK